jgi:DNA invertase Pin-like site-specific DNA recombinase
LWPGTSGTTPPRTAAPERGSIGGYDAGTREGARITMTNAARAAQYVRMSTEHQQYSTENQADVIREYAVKRGLEVVRTFEDSGKSGLRLDGRGALKELIAVVQAGRADFSTILVYDVSRWGRFQDADESAYYEYICKRAGITVQYCAEQFENDGSPVSTIVKGVKRAMAGEYSRELSAKVFKGQCKLIEVGFRQGGVAGFGLRRMLVDQAGHTKGELKQGEQKSIQTDRVILVPGPPEEVETVRRIYRMFIDEKFSEAEIASVLEVVGERRWSRGTVHQILTNEKYIGHNVYNRVSFKLKKQRVHNPPEMWVRNDDAFVAIVEPRDFHSAQAIILERHRRLSDDEMLGRLRGVLARHGRLSALLIDEAEGVPSSTALRHRFGSLLRAYQLISYAPEHDYAFVEVNRQLRRMHPQIIDDTAAALGKMGGRVERDPDTDLLTVNGIISASIVLARCRRTAGGALRWVVQFDRHLLPDLTVAVRMDAANASPLDYYLLPALDMTPGHLRLAEENGVHLDTFRFDTLDFFVGIAAEIRIEEAL